MTYLFLQLIVGTLTAELLETPLLESQHQKLIEEIKNCCRADSAVLALLKSRITQTWRTLFRKGTITTQDAAALKYNPCVTSRIIKTCTLARSIFNNNLLVHGDRYGQLIREILAAM